MQSIEIEAVLTDACETTYGNLSDIRATDRRTLTLALPLREMPSEMANSDRRYVSEAF